MTPPQISAENVWKKFRTGERHDSLRDLVPATVRRLVKGRPDPKTLGESGFWALQGVSLTVGPGQALGVIGHNGAGKSTLLKLLTRILRPTIGTVRATGRVGALIEVAAGFHPDLTGRENVFLQGAIMGMPKSAIERRFDDIIDFAGVSQFIDTPVKRYSSGMNARLGFAIAVHLEPDVLIIDEVLAVGDLTFQEHAFSRMREVVRSGIPVIVVSHQLDRITELCTEAILLRHGEIVQAGSPADCVRAYVKGESTGNATAAALKFGSLRLEDIKAVPTQVNSGSQAQVVVAGTLDLAPEGIRRFIIGIRVRRMETGQVIFSSSSIDAQIVIEQPGPVRFSIDLQMNVPAGLYAIETWVDDADTQLRMGLGPATHLQVAPGRPFHGTSQLNAQMALD